MKSFRVHLLYFEESIKSKSFQFEPIIRVQKLITSIVSLNISFVYLCLFVFKTISFLIQLRKIHLMVNFSNWINICLYFNSKLSKYKFWVNWVKKEWIIISLREYKLLKTWIKWVWWSKKSVVFEFLGELILGFFFLSFFIHFFPRPFLFHQKNKVKKTKKKWKKTQKSFKKS